MFWTLLSQGGLHGEVPGSSRMNPGLYNKGKGPAYGGHFRQRPTGVPIADRGGKCIAVRTVLPTYRSRQKHQLPLPTCHVTSGPLEDVERDRAGSDCRAAAMAADLPPVPARDVGRLQLALAVKR